VFPWAFDFLPFGSGVLGSSTISSKDYHTVTPLVSAIKAAG
jgi:hypothetical protein